MSTGQPTAPRPPGALGTPVEPARLEAYLGELDGWLVARRRLLDQLDDRAREAGRAGDTTVDLSLALASWKAIRDRHQLVVATFDGGRADRAGRERIAALLWGRLDGANVDLPGGVAVSLHEACRLNDALTAQLQAQLSVRGDELAITGRLQGLRAQLARLEDQVAGEPDDARADADRGLEQLRERVRHVEREVERGADVGGVVAPLEQDAARWERDLIVGQSRRRAAQVEASAVQERREDLVHRAHALQALADRCAATVDPAPVYAVPQVSALGPVPTDPDAVAHFRRRLDRVSAALHWAQDRYAAALDEHAALRDELDELVARAVARGWAAQPDLAAAEGAAREVLDRRPSPMAVARQAVATYAAWVEHLQAGESR